jgi:hypothetical protein
MWRLSVAWSTPIYELENMSGSLMAEAMAYYSIEPFGANRDNIHAGLICSTIANVNRSKNQKPFTAGDFMLKHKSDEQQVDHSALFSVLSRFAVTKT